MDKSLQIMSEFIIYDKYARYIPELKRRETWDEIVDRCRNYMLKKFNSFEHEINQIFEAVRKKEILPSMRFMQFAGEAIDRDNMCMYNCCYAQIDSPAIFGDIMYNLMCGTGQGYSVLPCHIEKLPMINKSKEFENYVISDDIYGWANAIKRLVCSYYDINPVPCFDFSLIRKKGSRLKTRGGFAPGPEPLIKAIKNITAILDSRKQSWLSSIDIHDIICHMADAVWVGGIRRAALICLFHPEDELMLNAKSNSIPVFDVQHWHKDGVDTIDFATKDGQFYTVEIRKGVNGNEYLLDRLLVDKTDMTIGWWEIEPQRARANNSAVLLRNNTSYTTFSNVFDKTRTSMCGEPGFCWTYTYDMGTNPCQPKSATVITRKGLTRIGDLKIGDEVYSPEGWARVYNIVNNKFKKVYKYRTPYGYFYGTDKHKVLLNGDKIDVAKVDKLTISRGPLKTVDGISKEDVDMGVAIVTNYNELSAKYITNDIFTKDLRDRYIPSEYYGNNYRAVSLLQGIFSKIGYIDEDRGLCIEWKCNSLLDEIQSLLNSLGIISTVKYKSNLDKFDLEGLNYVLAIKNDIFYFEKYIGIDSIVNAKLNIDIKKFEFKSTDTFESDIYSVDYLGEMEVFDITLENYSHTYVSNGIVVSNCGEIGLYSHQCCNLFEINGRIIDTQEKFNELAKLSSWGGTFQAYFTNFPEFISGLWKERCERERLLGIGITGIVAMDFDNLNFREAVDIIKEENIKLSERLGINASARLTCIKPSGTTSLVLGTSSGIHAYHSPYYLRTIRVAKNRNIYNYLKNNFPDLIEDCVSNPIDTAILTLPVKAPENASFRDEGAINFLERIKYIYQEWVVTGHVSGENTHNVSCTVSVKENEWDEVKKWMWDNRDEYASIALLPYDEHIYKQAPHQDCDEETYNKYMSFLGDIDFSSIEEPEDLTNFLEVTCTGGVCEYNGMLNN